MAPELALKKKHGQGVDVWSLGILCYMLLTGSRPFPGIEKKDIFKGTLNNEPDYKLLSKFTNNGDNVIKFIKSCLIKDPAKRPTLQALFHSQWIKTY
jgi:serine/threonine protein kinase